MPTQPVESPYPPGKSPYERIADSLEKLVELFHGMAARDLEMNAKREADAIRERGKTSSEYL